MSKIKLPPPLTHTLTPNEGNGKVITSMCKSVMPSQELFTVSFRRTVLFALVAMLLFIIPSVHGLQLITVDHPNPDQGSQNFIGLQGLDDAIQTALYSPTDTEVCIRIYGSNYVLTHTLGIYMNVTSVQHLTIESAYGPDACTIWGYHDWQNAYTGTVFAIFSHNGASTQKVTIRGIKFRYDGITNAIIHQYGYLCGLELTDNIFDTFCRAVRLATGPHDHEANISIRNNVFIRHHDSSNPTETDWSLLDFSIQGRVKIDIIDNRFENAFLPLMLSARWQTTTITGNEFHSPRVVFPAWTNLINRIDVQRSATQNNTNHPDSFVLFDDNLFVNVMLATDNIDTTINGNTFWITDDLVYNDAHNIIELSNLLNFVNHDYTINANVTDNLFHKLPSALTQINGVKTLISSNNSLIDLQLTDNSVININRALVIDIVPDAPFTNPSIVNNIFSCVNDPFVYGCSDLSDLTNPIVISHSIFQNGFPGDTDNFQIDPLTCVVADPLIVIDNENRTYTLTWTGSEKSPCINAGYPGENNELTDPDGTPPDIGCVYYPHHNQKYFRMLSSTGIEWLSFPVLDDRTCLDNIHWNELGYLFRTHMLDTPDNSQLDQVQWSYYGLRPLMAYSGGEWLFSNDRVIQPKGYKVKFNTGISIDPIVVNGFKANPETTPAMWTASVEDDNEQVVPFENLIGYFVPFTQKAGDALSRLLPGSIKDKYLDYVYSIKTRHWGTCRLYAQPGSPWIIDPNTYTLSEGEMVALFLLPDAPSEMFWNAMPNPVPPNEKPPATAFRFEEKLDYTPVFIEFDPADMPNEVGLFVDGVCKGAAVVDSSLIDVCFYNEEAKAGGELEIVFYYEGKGKKAAKGWTSYNPDSMVFENGGIDVNTIGNYAYISFRSGEGDSLVPLVTALQPNYPNPFNPNTTISFILAKDMDARLEIYNLRGQRVKTLCNTQLTKGKHTLLWNGQDEHGRQVSSGIYFSRLLTPEGSFAQKMMLMK